MCPSLLERRTESGVLLLATSIFHHCSVRKSFSCGVDQFNLNWWNICNYMYMLRGNNKLIFLIGRDKVLLHHCIVDRWAADISPDSRIASADRNCKYWRNIMVFRKFVRRPPRNGRGDVFLHWSSSRTCKRMRDTCTLSYSPVWKYNLIYVELCSRAFRTSISDAW